MILHSKSHAVIQPIMYHQVILNFLPLENADVIYEWPHRGYSFDPTILIQGGSKHLFQNYLIFKGYSVLQKCAKSLF